MQYLEEKHNWDIHTKDKNECDAYLFASVKGQIEVMQYLEEKHHWDIHTKNHSGKDAYLLALEFRQLEVIKYLEKKYKPKNCFCMERINKTKECCICLEEFGKGNICSICENSHIFHIACFSNVLKDECPVCRGKMTDKTITK